MVFIMLLYIQIILFLELSISLNELYPYFWKFFQIFEVFFGIIIIISLPVININVWQLNVLTCIYYYWWIYLPILNYPQFCYNPVRIPCSTVCKHLYYFCAPPRTIFPKSINIIPINLYLIRLIIRKAM